MKNSEEMVASLLERRERYAAAQRKRRRALLGAGVGAGCLVILIGVAFRQSRTLPNAPDISLNGTTAPTETVTQPAPSESQTAPPSEAHLVVNLIEASPSGAPTVDMDVQFTRDAPRVAAAFEEMLGISYETFSAKLPAGYTCTAFYSIDTPDGQGGYRPHDYRLILETADGGQAAIALSAIEAPLRDCMILCESPDMSEIGGVSLVILGTQDMLMVQFSHENINYDIETSDLTLEALETLLRALIE